MKTIKVVILTLILTLSSLLSFGGEKIDLSNPIFIESMDIQKKPKSSHNNVHVSEGAVLMLSGVVFMGFGLFTPQESHWEGEESWHEDPSSGSFVATPIYMQSSRMLPLLTGIVVFIPGVAIAIGN